MSKKDFDTVLLRADKSRMTGYTGTDGETYIVDRDGFLELPLGELENAKTHGFREATQEDIDAPKTGDKKKA